MGKEHLKHPSIYKDYEDWEIEQLEPHEPIGNKNRSLSIKHGLYMYVNRKYHRWLHDTHEGRIKNRELQAEMQEKWMDHNNKSIADFMAIFGENYL